jgi:hypothetical protein
MGRKCNTKHFRTSGGYRRRLEARGLSRAPAMPSWSPAQMTEWRNRSEQRRREGR